MSKMNFCFKTNMYDFDKSLPTPTVDYIAFEGNGKKISISCCDWSNFGIRKGTYDANSSSYAVNSKELTYDAVFKGLECEVSAGEEILHEYDEMKAEDFEMLKGTSITEIGIYSDNVRFNNPVMAKDVCATVCFEEEELFWHESQVPVINYDDYECSKVKIMIENDKWEFEKDLEEEAELEER